MEPQLQPALDRAKMVHFTTRIAVEIHHDELDVRGNRPNTLRSHFSFASTFSRCSTVPRTSFR
ncbi:hypothetical protein SBA2_560009 [Acidobacteriia bacterium SbA2]|nr:hypothetical protein SBA2_560009 [Acidobacteriia bacterium SbA2]